MSDKRKVSATDIEVLTSLEAVRRRPEMYVGRLEQGEGWLHALNLALSWLHRQARSRCGERQSIAFTHADEATGPFRFSWSAPRLNASPFDARKWSESLSRMTDDDGGPNLEGVGVLNALSAALTLAAETSEQGFEIRCATEASIETAAPGAPCRGPEAITLRFRPGSGLAPHPPAPGMLRGYLLCFAHERPSVQLVVDPSLAAL
ncbi:MAG: hypothetical protein AAGM38_08770 [Pseudomonadota bacterium]